MKVPGSLPRSRFLDVTQRSFGGALHDIQKTAAREIRSQGNMTLCLSINYAQICT